MGKTLGKSSQNGSPTSLSPSREEEDKEDKEEEEEEEEAKDQE